MDGVKKVAGKEGPLRNSVGVDIFTQGSAGNEMADLLSSLPEYGMAKQDPRGCLRRSSGVC